MSGSRASAPTADPSRDHVVAVDRLVDGSGCDGPAWLRVRGGVVVERGSGHAPDPGGAHPPAGAHLPAAVPGFVDGHCHGAAGVDLAVPGSDPGPVLRHHAAAGTTALVASLASAPLGRTAERLRELSPLVRAGELLGLHLEGPWLAPARRGAHAAGLLREPRPDDVEVLLEAGGGAVRMVTLAPELPGALDAVARLVDAGVVVALGHTDASAEQVRRALDLGASVVTHLFNGMPPLHHREPGPVGAALLDGRVTVEVIGDGQHVDDDVVDLVRRLAPGRTALVSDAMAAAGLGDGRYELAGAEVVVRDGVARTADERSLAGSTATVGDAVARLLARGADLPEVAALTSVAPTRALGLTGTPLAVGAPADLVEVVDGRPRRVLRRGTWLDSSS
ncbi:N-acetylglucosamine-6-phosphate deacetylase [uncultured Pseudokineococcus sp.]|uniref:N-acetylglucosamine-6-phosphate deacetylase n=1 Tax=uncultured Pseudokineococcus sp. TaxID=1642928 RepID=UPI002617BD96|nr:amidohydrolase family protein [uncultured Pseudokineococcus sp.]